MADKIKIIAIVGKSGSGKSSIADMLSEEGVPAIQSYTTRPKRGEGDTHHVFLTEEEFDKLDDSIASTKYGKYRYCGRLPESDSKIFSYVIDEVGLAMLRKDDRFEVFSLMVIAPSHERMDRTSKERFERDNDYVYSLKYDGVILNNKSLELLKKETVDLLKKLKDKWNNL